MESIIVNTKENERKQLRVRSRFYFRITTLMFSIGLLLLITVLSLGFGSVEFTVREIIDVLTKEGDTVAHTIILKSRLPRALISLMIGSNLAVAGALLQSVMRNPLADPGIIGVSSGAALVAVTLLLVFPAYAHILPIGAFAGGTAASFFVYLLAWKKGVDPIRMVLSGVAVNAVLGAGISLLSILFSDRIQGVMMWMNGSIAGKSWVQVWQLLPYSIVGLFGAMILANLANILLLGDDSAKSLGINVSVVRIILCIIASFLTGVSVATVGIIGFIGLIIPHVARLIMGSDYRFLLPTSAIMGALLMVVADTAARFLFTPLEMPVGIVMALAGGPFFIYLLRKRRSYEL